MPRHDFYGQELKTLETRNDYHGIELRKLETRKRKGVVCTIL